jgi:hypothetical protein
MPERFALVALVVLALMVSGCSDTDSYENNPKPPAVLTVSVIVGEDDIALSPRPFGAGPTRFIVTNQTGTQQVVTFASDRDEQKVPVGKGQTANFKMTTEPGFFGISASNTAADGVEVEVGPKRPSAQQDLNQP